MFATRRTFFFGTQLSFCFLVAKACLQWPSKHVQSFHAVVSPMLSNPSVRRKQIDDHEMSPSKRLALNPHVKSGRKRSTPLRPPARGAHNQVRLHWNRRFGQVSYYFVYFLPCEGKITLAREQICTHTSMVIDNYKAQHMFQGEEEPMCVG